MPKFRIDYIVTQTCSTDIEAENANEAIKIFNDLEEVDQKDIIEENFEMGEFQQVAD